MVHHLRATTGANDWNPEVLECLRYALLHTSQPHEQDCDVHQTANALRQWLDTIPEDAATRIDTVLPQESAYFLACLIPPLCVWAKSTDWGRDIDLADATTFALELLNRASAPILQTPQMRATLVAARVLRDTMPLVRHSNDAWDLLVPWVLTSHRTRWPVVFGFWEKERHLFPLFLDLWMTTAEAVVLADAKRNANTLSTPLSDRWRNKIGNVFRVLNDTEDAQLVARILNASFSSPFKIKACLQARSSSWLDSDIHSQMVTMLPKDEMARLQHLPWIEHDAEANRKIAYAYAPESALLLDNIGDSRVWTQRTSWNEMVTALMHAKDTPMLALVPLDGDVFDSIPNAMDRPSKRKIPNIG